MSDKELIAAVLSDPRTQQLYPSVDLAALAHALETFTAPEPPAEPPPADPPVTP